MDKTALKKMSRPELQKMLAERKEELRIMRFKAWQQEIKDIRKIRSIKKDIARILTRLNEQK